MGAVAAVNSSQHEEKFRLSWRKDGPTTLYIMTSALLSAIALRYFAQIGHLVPGGFSGLSLLIIQLFSHFFSIEIPFYALYILLNLPVTILVFRYVGRRFALYSILQYLLTSLLVALLPPFVGITHQIMLLAIVGGIINGFAIVIALRANASTGGTDFIAIFTSARFNKPTWNYIMGYNACMLIVAGLVFGWERAIYSIVYQFSSMEIVKSFHQRYKLMTIEMITEIPDEVAAAIQAQTRHGITELWGEGFYSKQPKCFLYMVVNAVEVNTVVQQAKRVDPHVFVNIQKSQRIEGNYYQKPME